MTTKQLKESIKAILDKTPDFDELSAVSGKTISYLKRSAKNTRTGVSFYKLYVCKSKIEAVRKFLEDGVKFNPKLSVHLEGFNAILETVPKPSDMARVNGVKDQNIYDAEKKKDLPKSYAYEYYLMAWQLKQIKNSYKI